MESKPSSYAAAMAQPNKPAMAQSKDKAPLSPPLSAATASPKLPLDTDQPLWKASSPARRTSSPNIQLLTPTKDDKDWRFPSNIWISDKQPVQTNDEYRRSSLAANHDSQRKFSFENLLKINEEKDYLRYVAPKSQRSRSKSSSAIFNLDNLDAHADTDNSNSQIWTMGQQPHPQNRDSFHRRASTQQTSYNKMWDLHADESPQFNSYRLQERRFSHAPVLNSDYAKQLLNGYFSLTKKVSFSSSESDNDDYSPAISMDTRRRHSVASPYSQNPNRHLAEALENVNLETTEDPPIYSDINDYFENTEHRTRAWVEAGKSLQLQSFAHSWPLYVVEFKAGRHDFFFVDDPSNIIKTGDLVICEADRGKDLGKVIHDSIKNIEELQQYQASHVDPLVDSQYGKDVHPKRIFRAASPPEVALLVSKSQDEAKTMAIAQSKIRQKKLPMEVVDAEYQWDRRKLTLYFVADRRIDFRELVRDLFKIYKTRIWMCAVNPLSSCE